jgi:hypothetical protein
MYIGLVHATGSVSRTSKLVVCSFAHGCSTQIRDLFAWPPRLPVFYTLLPVDDANASSRKQSFASSLTTLQQPSRLHVVLRASACSCLARSTCTAIFPSPYPACRMNAPLARALALLTGSYLLRPHRYLACPAGGPYREHRPPCTPSYSYSYSVQYLILPIHPREQRDQQDETPLGTRSSRSATYTVNARSLLFASAISTSPKTR